MSVYVENSKKSVYIRTTPSWQKYDSLTLQHSYKVFQTKIFKELVQKKKTDLEKYKTKKLMKREKDDYPYAILAQDLEKLAHQNIIFLRNANQLWSEAKNVTDSIRPILLYYSWQQFNAFFIYTLFNWGKPSQGHGVRYNLGVEKPDEIEGISIEFHNNGFFRRLVDTFVVLGNPSAYGPWIPLGENQGLFFEENRIESRLTLNKMKLVDVLKFDPQKFDLEFKSIYPKRYYGSHIDTLLTDFLLIFIASNIARYRPHLWQDILIGKGNIDAEYNLKLKKAYRNYDVSHNCLLDVVWSIFLKYT